MVDMNAPIKPTAEAKPFAELYRDYLAAGKPADVILLNRHGRLVGELDDEDLVWFRIEL